MMSKYNMYSWMESWNPGPEMKRGSVGIVDDI